MPKLDTIIAIKPPTDKKGRRKGIIKPRPGEDPWRRRQRDQYNYLKVFDVGLTAAGADTDLFYHRPEPASPTFVQFLGPSPITLAMDGTTQAARQTNWNSQMLAVDHEDWPTTYKEITGDLADYSLAISGFDEYVTGQGLRSSSLVDSITIIPTSLANEDKWFPRWPMGGLVPRNVKYTNSASYGAASVSFTFDADCDLFLVPSTMYGLGICTYHPGLGYPIYGHQYHFVQRVRSRNTLLGNANWDDVWNNRATPSSIGSGGKSLLVSYFLEDPDGQTYRLRATTAGGAQPIDGDNPVQLPGTDFPLVSERSDWRVSAEINVPHLDIIFGSLEVGKLIAVIRKHLAGGLFEWYFVWSTSTFGGPQFVNNVEV